MLQRVARTLARYRFDVLHVHEPCIPGLPWAAVMRAISPTVGTFHAALQSSALYSLLAPLARLAMDNLEVKIAVSAAALDYLAGRFPGDYRIIPNGVDVQEYRRARSGSRVPGRILYVGRADPRKGLTVLLRAFALVRREMPWASLVLAGPSTDEVTRLMAGAGPEWSGRPLPVTVLGWVDLERKIEQMAQAEVLCSPSLEGESFGIVLAEALAAGVPVVASDLRGYRAVLRDGATGVLTRPGDAAELAAALLRVLSDEPLRSRLSEAGSAVVEEYSWDKVARRVAAVYEEALERGAARGRRRVAEIPAH
jgi:phosphatidylinositol alpha-mannosyltransferase